MPLTSSRTPPTTFPSDGRFPSTAPVSGKVSRTVTPTGSTSAPMLDRSLSQRAAPTQPTKKPLDRSVSQRHIESSTRLGGPPPNLQKSQSQRAPQPSQDELARSKSKTQQQAATGTATPRRREKAKENADVVARLKAICTDADPTKMYRNMVKIGQG